MSGNGNPIGGMSDEEAAYRWRLAQAHKAWRSGVDDAGSLTPEAEDIEWASAQPWPPEDSEA